MDHTVPSASDDADIANYVRWLDSLWEQRLRGKSGQKPDLSVGILLWPTFPMMSLTGIVEPLRHAADFADRSQPLQCRWSIMGKPGESVAASCGIRVRVDAHYINPTDLDYLFVVGGLLPQLGGAPWAHRDYTRVAAAAGTTIVGVCTGSFVLAQEGLLDGRSAAIHPFHADDFRAAFPRREFSIRNDFVMEDGRITVPGGISVLSLMTQLLRRHCGPDRAAKAVHQLSLTGRKRLSVFDHERAASAKRVADARLQKAIVLIESRKGQDISSEQAAAAVGMSARQFGRLFQSQIGLNPKRYILDTKLRFARFLVENSPMPITEVALEAGFADSSHLATAFRKKYAVSPRACRLQAA